MIASHKMTEHFQDHLKWALHPAPIWERANAQRVVSMAACIVDGVLIVGNRHFCPVMRMTIDLMKLDCHKHDFGTQQGFVDQWGVYMSRQEAWDVAKAAGQIKEVFQEGVLYSECYL